MGRELFAMVPRSGRRIATGFRRGRDRCQTGSHCVDLTVVIQKLAFGLFVGSNYGVVAVGLTLIFGVMRVLNVGHGELLMLGGYVSYFAFTMAGVDPYLSVAISALCLFGLGIVLNSALFQF